jgi:nucleotide-binding universal stress UspA family protein
MSTAGNQIPPKHILLAVDGSENSLRASKLGMAMAKQFGATLTIAYAILFQGFLGLEEPTMSKTVDSVLESYKTRDRQRAGKFLEEMLAEAKREGIDAKVQVLENYSSAVEAIVSYASNNAIDLIVIGSRGTGTFKKLLLGSTSSGVVLHAHCSVLVAK